MRVFNIHDDLCRFEAQKEKKMHLEQLFLFANYKEIKSNILFI